MNFIHEHERIKSFPSPFKLKPIYRKVICGLFAGALVLGILSYLSWLGCDSQAARLIQIVTALAIAVTTVIALSNADLPKEKVKADIQPYITKGSEKWEETYQKKDLKPDLCRFFDNCPDPIKSYKVQFKITNTSNFDWVEPVVTFWLPVEKQHPQKKEEQDILYSSLSYNSNTYNTPVAVRKLQMVDGVIISNKHLPYWKQKRDLTIWIKMVLENGGKEPFDVEVSVDSENAEGFAQTVRLDPDQLLKRASDSETARMHDQVQTEQEGHIESARQE